jgi:replicative DNA helicase
MATANDLLTQRVPPNNVEAERAVLGAVILEGQSAIARLGGLIDGAFYVERHRMIYAAAMRLAVAGEPVDVVTLAHELARREHLDEVGGPAALAQLVDEAGLLANVGAYAQIVRECAGKRELIRCATEVIGGAYDAGIASAEVIERLRATIAESESRVVGGGVMARLVMPDHPRRVGEVLDDVWRDLDRPRPPSDFLGSPIPELDERLGGGLLIGEYVVLGGRPGQSKTSLAVQWAVLAASAGHPTLIVSREMRNEALAGRLLSQVCGVQATAIRQRSLDLVDRRRVADALPRLRGLPLWLDDGATTIAQIHQRVAQARYRFVVVDYLQLVRAPEAAKQQRRLEVTAVSAGLKAIAHELGCCSVLGLSSLRRPMTEVVGGRGKKRAVKRMPPTLEDLKECLTGDALVTMADGLRVPISSLPPGGRIQAWSAALGRFVVTALGRIWNRGTKPVVAVSTRNGRCVRATRNHPFWTSEGWLTADQLRVGMLLGIPRVLTRSPGPPSSLTPDLARFLGYMTGDGFCQRHRGVGFINADPALLADVHAIVAAAFDGIHVRARAIHGSTELWFSRPFSNGYGRPRGNPLRNWLVDVGLGHHRDCDKRIPASIMVGDPGIIAHFLAGLFATDGTLAKHASGVEAVEAKIASSSRGLLEDCQALLSYLGITATIDRGYIGSKATRPLYNLRVARRSLAALKCVPIQGRKRARLLAMPEGRAENAGLERLPLAATACLERYCRQAQAPPRAFGYRIQGKRMSRAMAARLAERGVVPLQWWADCELAWDPVRGIEPAGMAEVWDAEVPEARTFLANGLVVHNSGDVEHDADVVLLLWQPDLEQPDRELIFAKLRHGQTGGQVPLPWDPMRTRFTNREGQPPGAARMALANPDDPANDLPF